VDRPEFVSLVRKQLELAGLTGRVFDPEEVADDLLERIELNGTLDEIIVPSDLVPAPTFFQPGWPQ